VRPLYLGKPGERSVAEPTRSDHVGTLQNTKSVQEVSKHRGHTAPRGHYGKTDLRYWQAAIFQPTRTRNGVAHRSSHWAVKIQHLGRRETFSLGTSNRTAAAAKAKALYLTLKSSGWDAALSNFKPKSQPQSELASTVGEFLKQVVAIAAKRPKTIQGYCRAFRTIVADIFDIDGGNAKYDYCTGGRSAWLAKINKVKLSDITPQEVQKWKLRFLRRAGDDPVKQRAARISVNSMMRQAKSLFAPAILKFVSVELPSALPFTGIAFEKRQSMRYRSSFKIEKLIGSAQRQLPPEQLKILLLAIIGWPSS
jgi:hypothetical protein